MDALKMIADHSGRIYNFDLVTDSSTVLQTLQTLRHPAPQLHKLSITHRPSTSSNMEDFDSLFGGQMHSQVIPIVGCWPHQFDNITGTPAY